MRLDGTSLTAANLSHLAQTPEQVITLCPTAMERVHRSRALLEQAVQSGQMIYGVNTGMGGFASYLIPTEQANTLQNNLIAGVATNVGPLFPDDVVRAAMIARANSLVRGHSAIKPENLETYVAMINRGVIPHVPQEGSLGASGDLGPLAHIALVATGRWKARYQGRDMTGAEAMAAAGLQPMQLDYKEGLALINGTSFMAALASLVVEQARTLIHTYHAISCLAFEGLRAHIQPFDPLVHSVKDHAGQLASAGFLTRFLEGSQLVIDDTSNATMMPRSMGQDVQQVDLAVEDAYSIRCTPQVLGPVLDQLAQVEQVVSKELNTTTDNPLVLPDEGRIIHNGHFHGQYISMAMDNLTIALASLANLADRRIDRFLDAANSNGLPPFLCNEDPGLRFGLMGGQFMATSLTAEIRSMTIPVSVQTLTSTGDFQDHVSFGLVAGRRTRDVMEKVGKIVAFEALCAAQAVDIHGKSGLSPAGRNLYQTIRAHIPYLAEDRVLTDYLEAINASIMSGDMQRSAEMITGPFLHLFTPEEATRQPLAAE